MINNIVKGDTIILECKINADITNWKIRFELIDSCNHCIKLASANVTGGSSDQIEIIEIEAEKSSFLVKVPSDATECFDDIAQLELEIDTGNIVNLKPEVCTIWKAEVDFKKQIITWIEI